MLSVVCKLTFPDGQEVTGKIEAKSPATDYPFVYTGPAERLKSQPASGTASDLELLFRLTAHREGATLTVERSGAYESRTEFIKRPEP